MKSHIFYFVLENVPQFLKQKRKDRQTPPYENASQQQTANETKSQNNNVTNIKQPTANTKESNSMKQKKTRRKHDKSKNIIIANQKKHYE